MPVKILPVTGMNSGLGAIGAHIRYVDNMMAVAGSYRPLPLQVRFTDQALTDAPVNGMHVHLYPTSAGTSSYTGDRTTTFVGTKTRIYDINTNPSVVIPPADLSRAANYAQTVGDEPCAWSFCSFGNDVIASNFVDEIQYRPNNAGLFQNLITSAFKPQARHVAIVRTALMAANLEGSAAAGTGFSDEYAWSVFGNAASFDPAGGAGRQRSLARAGQITGLVGGDFARLFKATSISGLQFTGSSTTPWREDLISLSRGTVFSKSIVDLGDGGVAFWGGDSFYRQEGMNPPYKIGRQLGAEMINYGAPIPLTPPFNRHLPIDPVFYPTGMLSEDRVFCAGRCLRTGIVMWLYEHYPGLGSAPAAKKKGVIWDPESDLWAWIDLTYPVAALAPYLDLSAEYILSGLGGVIWTGSTTNWFRFSSVFCEPAKISWAAEPIALTEADEPVTVRVRGVLPLFTWDVDTTHAAAPALQVEISAYDDPYIAAVAGGQPREATLTVGVHDDDWGWLREPLEGRLFKWELIIPTNDTRIPAIAALAIDYEVLP